MNFCPQCGTKVVVTWNVCPNCAYNLKSERVIQPPVQSHAQVKIHQQDSAPKKTQYQPQDYPSRNNTTNGIIALIFGLLGLFSVIPVVGSILGIVFGAIGRKKDDNPKMAIAGLVLGIIGIVVWMVFYIWMFSFIFMMFRYLPD